MNTIKEIIDDASKKIGYMEASMIMEYALKMDKAHIIANGNMILENSKINEIKNYIVRIKNGYPIQYITHKQEFVGLEFYVDENVLIPQPDTEVLVEETLKVIEERVNDIEKREHNKGKVEKIRFRILDLCTGSGAIAISIANYIANQIYNKLEQKNFCSINQGHFENKQVQLTENIMFEIIASDISKKALEVAKKNYENIILDNCKRNENCLEIKSNQGSITIDFVESDCFENIEGKFDVIVSNPPYIKNREIMNLSKDVQNEPHIALDGGEDGLKFYKVIKENINSYLKENGCLLMEIGYDQRKDLLGMFKGAECIKDLSGNDRVIKVQF